MRRQSGFTLIELIISMVIMGIILTVGSMFFGSMLKGLMTSRRSADIGQAAQLAMDRLAFEIKHADNRSGTGTVGFTADTSFIYESASTTPDLTGTTRTIELVGTTLVIDVDGVDHTLLEDVNNFTMSVVENNIDGNSGNGNEISSVDMTFQVTGYGGTFSLQVAPRQFIRQ